MSKERFTASYDREEKKENDLKEQIKKLIKKESTPYWKRSLSEASGMMLREYLPQILKKYGVSK